MKKNHQSFNTEYNVSCGHVINNLHYVEAVSPYSVSLSVLYHESSLAALGCSILVSTEIIMLDEYITLILSTQYIKPPLHSRNKTHLVLVQDSFYVS